MARKLRGKELESYLNRSNKLLRDLDKGLVLHVPTPLQILRRSPKSQVLTARLMPKLFVDYLGFVSVINEGPGACPVVIEAKEVGLDNDGQIPKDDRFRMSKGRLNKFQEGILKTCAKLGACTGVYVTRKVDLFRTQHFFVPVTPERGVFPIIWEDCKKWEVLGEAMWWSAVVDRYGNYQWDQYCTFGWEGVEP